VGGDDRLEDQRPKRHWNKPSLDFLFLDVDGRIIAVELKGTILTRQAAWSALCQVTHRAVELSRGFTPELLAAAYDDCHSVTGGRVGVSSEESLLEAHRRFFSLSTTPLLSHNIRRVVACVEFGPDWQEVLTRFNTTDPRAICEHLQAHYNIDAN
jgi:hypothetical protein